MAFKAKRMHSGGDFTARMAEQRAALAARGPALKLTEAQAAAEAATLGAAITMHGTQVYVTDRLGGTLLGAGFSPEAALAAARNKLRITPTQDKAKEQDTMGTQTKNGKAKAQAKGSKTPAAKPQAAPKAAAKAPAAPKKPAAPAPQAAKPAGAPRPQGATKDTYQNWLSKRAAYRQNSKATPLQAKIGKKLRAAAAFMRKALASTKGWPEAVTNALQLAAAGADGAVAALEALPAGFVPEKARKRGGAPVISAGMTVRVKERFRQDLPKFGEQALEVTGREGKTLEILFQKKAAFIQENQVEVVAQ